MNKHVILKAVIFDVDGTIIDTEQIQSDAYLGVLESFGINNVELTEHGTVHTPGETTAQTWERLKSKHTISTNIEELTNQKRNHTLNVLRQGIKPFPGFISLIKNLQENNIKMALASSAQRERLDLIVEGLHLEGVFDAIVSANDIQHVKPAPDIYLKAAEVLGVDVSECIAIEDADVGCISAKSAGMKVIAVPNKYTEKMDFKNVDCKVSSLTEIDYKKLVEIIES